MRLVVHKEVLEQVFLPDLRFSPVSIIPPMLHTHLHIETVGMGTPNKAMLLQLSGQQCTEKYFHFVLFQLQRVMR